ncbi:MAG: HRDC domain-containing protein, partial [Brachybacterium paraconglomeratum]|nr:HRDC domain-containing protein [Brachybacterium paraconglomeratum]
ASLGRVRVSPQEKQIPPYMVFSDATLVGIVETSPQSVQQLGTVSGVGAKKLAEYGEDVLEALSGADAG